MFHNAAERLQKIKLLLPGEEDLDVLGMCVSQGDRLLLFADYINNSVKQVDLQTDQLLRVYKSDWRVADLLQIEQGNSLILLEYDPQYQSI